MHTNNPFRFLWRHRRLIFHTTISDFMGRYSGSMLGRSWAVINPLFLLSIYVILYVYILRVRMPASASASPFEYVLLIFTGLIPWLGVSEGLSTSVHSVVSNANLVHNTAFPAAVLPAKAVFASLAGQTIGLVILLVMLACTNHLSWTWICLPLAIAAQILFSLGLAWLLSVLNVFIRDLGQALPTTLLFIMLVSPIAYSIKFVENSPLRWLIYLNPVSYFIDLYRTPLLYGRLPDLITLCVAVALSLAVFVVGFRFFIRIAPYLTDHV